MCAFCRIARAVRDKYSVILESREIIAVRHPYHFHSPCKEASDDTVFYSTVHKYDFFALCYGRLASVCIEHLFSRPCVVSDYRGAGDIIRSGFCGLFLRIASCVRTFGYDASRHLALVTQKLCQLAGVNAIDSGKPLLNHPLLQAFHSLPVAVVLAIVECDKSAWLYSQRFEIL